MSPLVGFTPLNFLSAIKVFVAGILDIIVFVDQTDCIINVENTSNLYVERFVCDS